VMLLAWLLTGGGGSEARCRRAWSVLILSALITLGVVGWCLGVVFGQIPRTPAMTVHILVAVCAAGLTLAYCPVSSGPGAVLAPGRVSVLAILGLLAAGALAGGQWFMADGSGGPKDPSIQIEETLSEIRAREQLPVINCALLQEVQQREHLDKAVGIVRYTELHPGRGRYPGEDDAVVVHYRSMRLDGSEVDNTYKAGQPVVWRHRDTPALWAALSWMRPGAKWKVASFPNLSPEELKRRGITDQVFLYEIELLDVQRTTAGSDDQRSGSAQERTIRESNG